LTPLTISKKKPKALDSLDHKVTGESDQLSKESRLSLLEKLYKMAMDALPDYNKLRKELFGFHVELPRKPDASDLSDVNEKYALAQSYFSRCTEISMIAEGSFTLWKRVKLLLDDHIAERSAEIHLEDSVRELKIALQEATVRSVLKKEFRTKRTIESYLTEADSFRKTVQSRKDDIEAVLTTLAKQVKALALEQSLNR
jgi:hypothetical protein